MHASCGHKCMRVRTSESPAGWSVRTRNQTTKLTDKLTLWHTWQQPVQQARAPTCSPSPSLSGSLTAQLTHSTHSTPRAHLQVSRLHACPALLMQRQAQHNTTPVRLRQGHSRASLQPHSAALFMCPFRTRFEALRYLATRPGQRGGSVLTGQQPHAAAFSEPGWQRHEPTTRQGHTALRLFLQEVL